MNLEVSKPSISQSPFPVVLYTDHEALLSVSQVEKHRGCRTRL